MRIVFVINSLEGGGAERVVITLASWFATHGQDVTILTLQTPSTAFSISPSVVVRQLPVREARTGLGKLLAIPFQAMKLRSEWKRLRPDVVVSFLVRSNLVTSLATKGRRAFAVVLSERAMSDLHYSAYGRRAEGVVVLPLISLLYRSADAIIAISEGVRNSLRSIGVPASKIRVIHNPCDVAPLAPAPRERSFPLQRPQLVTLSRLTDFKDHPTMLRALKRIRETADAHLTIIGDGPLRHQIEALARELDVFEHVTFTGWLANPFDRLREADIFVYSSVYEAFGNVLVEALAAGLPIVSTDCPGGPTEILAGGKIGTLVPVGDSDALAAGVMELVDDGRLYEERRAAGLRRASEFDVPVVAQRYMDVFVEAMDGRTARE